MKVLDPYLKKLPKIKNSSILFWNISKIASFHLFEQEKMLRILSNTFHHKFCYFPTWTILDLKEQSNWDRVDAPNLKQFYLCGQVRNAREHEQNSGGQENRHEGRGRGLKTSIWTTKQGNSEYLCGVWRGDYVVVSNCRLGDNKCESERKNEENKLEEHSDVHEMRMSWRQQVAGLFAILDGGQY